MAETPPRAGDKAPDFAIESDHGRLTLPELLQKGRLVLAFYSEDSTPTCSTQVASLKEGFDTFAELDATVLGVSSDGLDSHAWFCDRLGGLPFPLASDADLSVARAYGVTDEGGRRSRRAVFVIDRDGTVLLSLPFYNPANLNQYEDVFRALGA